MTTSPRRLLILSALAALVADVDESARAALVAEIGAKLAPAIDDQGLSFPIETNIAVACS